MIVFSFLLNWASRAIGKAQYVKDLQMEAIQDLQFNVYTHKYFVSRSNQIFKLAKTYEVPAQIGLVQVQGLRGWTEARKNIVLTTLSEILVNSTSDLDIVARYYLDEIQFALLLVAADAKSTQELQKNIQTQFAKINFHPQEGLEAPKLMIVLTQISDKYNSIQDVLTQSEKLLPHETPKAHRLAR